AVGPIGVGFATARHGREVGLHELLKPRPHVRRLVFPLSKIPRCRRRRQQDERNDDAAHIRLFRPHPASPMGVGPPIEYVDQARTSLARNCCEFTCFASIAYAWPQHPGAISHGVGHAFSRPSNRNQSMSGATEVWRATNASMRGQNHSVSCIYLCTIETLAG